MPAVTLPALTPGTPVRCLRTGETGTTYSFKWSQLNRESHAELPVSVSLAAAAFILLARRPLSHRQCRGGLAHQRARGAPAS